jgi:hypothetical protein
MLPVDVASRTFGRGETQLQVTPAPRGGRVVRLRERREGHRSDGRTQNYWRSGQGWRARKTVVMSQPGPDDSAAHARSNKGAGMWESRTRISPLAWLELLV